MPDLPTQCPSCKRFSSNPDHSCINYDGPVCTTTGCEARTVVCHVGAPGYGTVRVCADNHHVELTRCGILTLEDVI